MALWPFKRGGDSGPGVDELREKLFTAARSGDLPTLRKVCRKWGPFVRPHVEALVAYPDSDDSSEEGVAEHDKLVQALAACLDEDCEYPEMADLLAMPKVDPANPLGPLEQWYGQLERRTARLEYDALVEEGRALVPMFDELDAATYGQAKSLLHARLGDLLMHSGNVREAIPEYEASLELACEAEFVEGQMLQLKNLMEAYGYLGDEKTVAVADELKELVGRLGGHPHAINQRLSELTAEEPMCRILCINDAKVQEIDQVTSISDGQYEFRYHRNHRPIYKVQVLTEQAKDLASAGDIEAAIDRFDEASDVDPLDPEPVYQLGLCLLEAGRYDEAAEAFAETEYLAPGWFGCRSDHWLASAMSEGRFSDQEFKVLRTLEDGGLDPQRRIELATRAAEATPDLAPLHLAIGNLHRQEGNRDAAEAAYRTGLQVAEEPDVESRLLCGLGSVLPIGSDERTAVLSKATNPQGNLVAAASAKLMSLQRAA